VNVSFFQLLSLKILSPSSFLSPVSLSPNVENWRKKSQNKSKNKKYTTQQQL
jgi:hypothetical protein